MASLDLRDHSHFDIAVRLELGEHTSSRRICGAGCCNILLVWIYVDTTSIIPTPTSASAASPSMSMASRSFKPNTPVVLRAVLALTPDSRYVSTSLCCQTRQGPPEHPVDGMQSILHSNGHTIITPSTTPIQPPPILASLPFASRSTITTLTSASTQTTHPLLLPPLITKQLPPTPAEGPLLAIQKGRSMLCAMSKRSTQALLPISLSTSTPDSVTLLFFLKPVYKDDLGMVSGEQSLRNKLTLLRVSRSG
ncbi:hypothetical protein BDP27DRAFT_1430649 [Rhodocollybia butyracea]|uniref:Uncharacterized protein n=1 Tax=Rhodocollybia butyracea TaxID=206335 RepID=A0A9P5PAX2_9AGAR|nr:hypothetical protein BDP27DRAFT_1430649 [Rhodocollybia butyracea]